jgi:hypothetical protein
LVVNDCWRCDSRTLDVATEAETEADTDARYAGAIAVSAFGAPSVTVVHPTTARAIIATQPTARAALCHPSLPIATGGDVTGWRSRASSAATIDASAAGLAGHYAAHPLVRHDRSYPPIADGSIGHKQTTPSSKE